MKKFTLPGLLAALMCLMVTVLSAQESPPDAKLVVVQRTKLDDGTETIVKKRFSDRAEALAYLKSLNEAGGTDVNIEVFDPGRNAITEDITKARGDAETVFYFRRAHEEKGHHEKAEGRDLEKLHIVMRGDGGAPEAVTMTRPGTGSERPYLGVYLEDGGAGVKVTGIVPGSGAAAAGLQAGDVITALNGLSTANAGKLREVLSGLRAGEPVDISYLREGQTRVTEATLGSRREQWQRDPCQVFIGVTLHSIGSEGTGVRISNIIEGTPAEEAQLRAGDVILAIDQVEVNSYEEVLRERNKHQPGDRFTLLIDRGGQVTDIQARFKSCETPAELPQEEKVEETPALETQAPVVPQTTVIEPERRLELINYRAFPNPTFGRFNLQFQGEALPTTIQVTGADGQVIYNERLNGFDGYYNKEVDISRSAPGTYFLQIRQGERVLAEKVVVVPRA